MPEDIEYERAIRRTDRIILASTILYVLVWAAVGLWLFW